MLVHSTGPRKNIYYPQPFQFKQNHTQEQDNYIRGHLWTSFRHTWPGFPLLRLHLWAYKQHLLSRASESEVSLYTVLHVRLGKIRPKISNYSAIEQATLQCKCFLLLGEGFISIFSHQMITAMKILKELKKQQQHSQSFCMENEGGKNFIFCLEKLLAFSSSSWLWSMRLRKASRTSILVRPIPGLQEVQLHRVQVMLKSGSAQFCVGKTVLPSAQTLWVTS